MRESGAPSSREHNAALRADWRSCPARAGAAAPGRTGQHHRL